MNLWSIIKNSLQSPNGADGYDPIRILFGIGGTNGVVMPIVFEIWHMWGHAERWDPIGFCTSYGGMLSAIVVAGGVAMKQKDVGVAQSNAITAKSDALTKDE